MSLLLALSSDAPNTYLTVGRLQLSGADCGTRRAIPSGYDSLSVVDVASQLCVTDARLIVSPLCLVGSNVIEGTLAPIVNATGHRTAPLNDEVLGQSLVRHPSRG